MCGFYLPTSREVPCCRYLSSKNNGNSLGGLTLLFLFFVVVPYYHLFSAFKKSFNIKLFIDPDDVKHASGIFKSKPQDFNGSGMNILPEKRQKFIGNNAYYSQSQIIFMLCSVPFSITRNNKNFCTQALMYFRNKSIQKTYAQNSGDKIFKQFSQ